MNIDMANITDGWRPYAETHIVAYYDARIALLRSEKEEMLQMIEEMVLADPFMGPVLRKRLVDLCIRMGSNDKFKELVS